MRLPLLALVLTAAPALGQLDSAVGPTIAPLGCPITISFSNDTPAPVVTGVCPYVVRDAAGTEVYPPLCILIAKIIDPGDTFETTWDQIDGFGVQVPPGPYFIDVFLPDGSVQSHTVQVGGTQAALTPIGVPKAGANRAFRLCSPADGGLPYLLAASASSFLGVPTCGGVLPLDPDAIFVASLTNGAVFQSFFGTLDADGHTDAPSIDIPASPGLVGQALFLAFLTLDAFAPCPVKTISSPLSFTIQ